MKNYKVLGMTCNNCKIKIEKKLKSTIGIKTASVDLKTKSIKLDYDSNIIGLKEIKEIVKDLGYEIRDSVSTNDNNNNKIWLSIGTALVLFMIVNRMVPDFSILLTSGYKLNIIMLFVIGITTSFHCVTMCGGLALSQVVSKNDNLKRNIMYNLGRVISYTVLGGVVGFIGAGITLNNNFFSVIPIILGVFMIGVGLSNAGIISLGRIKFLGKFNEKLIKLRSKLSNDKGPFVLGLLNGFMPCGPLQLMQIYALSTGSFVEGALAMLAFSLGTVPLMLGLGVFINKLSINSRELVFKVGGYLIVVLGISMMMNGLSTVGINTAIGNNKSVSAYENKAIIEDGYQVVNIEVGQRSYDDIVVQKGMPVKLVMNVAPGNLTSCNYAINISEYGITTGLSEGENIIEFTPDEEGTFTYSCWMGMIRNTIKVIDGDISAYIPGNKQNYNNFIPSGLGFSCH
ncbi:MAG: sulfite exporter TauE/SafE family protein [Peptostreptococcaceae bacterium]